MVTRLLNLDCSYVCGKLQRCLKQKPPAETTRDASASRRPGWPGICCVVAEAGGDKRDGGIAKQNNSVAIAFDPIDKYNLRQIHFKMMVLRSKMAEQLCLNCFWSIVCSLQPLQPLHTFHIKFLKLYIFLYDDESLMRLPDNKMLSTTQSCTFFRPSFFNQIRSWPSWLPHRLILLKFYILVFLSKFFNLLWTTLPSMIVDRGFFLVGRRRHLVRFGMSPMSPMSPMLVVSN